MEWHEKDEYLMLTPSGRLDAVWASSWNDEVLARVEKGTPTLFIINLADVDYVSSAFLRLLIIVQREAFRRGFSFFLLSPKGSTQQVLEMAGFDRIFQIADSLHEVLSLHRQSQTQTARVHSEGVRSEFTSNGYYHFSGTAPTTGVLYRLTPEYLKRDPSLVALGVSPELSVGFLAPSLNTRAAEDGLLVLGEALMHWNAVGARELLRTEDLAPVMSGAGAFASRGLFIFDRLDDRMSFGCRWPDRGVPIRHVAADVIQLALERRGLSRGVLGMLFVGERRDTEDVSPGRRVCLVVGLMSRQTDAAAWNLPDTDTFGREPQGTFITGTTLDFEAPPGLDLSQPDPFRTARILLESGKLFHVGFCRPEATVGNLVGALTCFREFFDE